MLVTRTSVLLNLPQAVVDRARTFAGTATAALKLAVSLQIVLRALIVEGLKPGRRAALLRNVERQALAVRDIRAAARRTVRGRSVPAAPTAAPAPPEQPPGRGTSRGR